MNKREKKRERDRGNEWGRRWSSFNFKELQVFYSKEMLRRDHIPLVI
jgi:hypothetical protein